MMNYIEMILVWMLRKWHIADPWESVSYNVVAHLVWHIVFSRGVSRSQVFYPKKSFAFWPVRTMPNIPENVVLAAPCFVPGFWSIHVHIHWGFFWLTFNSVDDFQNYGIHTHMISCTYSWIFFCFSASWVKEYQNDTTRLWNTLSNS